MLALIVSACTALITARLYIDVFRSEGENASAATLPSAPDTYPPETSLGEPTPESTSADNGSIDIGEDVLAGADAEKPPQKGRYTLKYEDGHLVIFAPDATAIFYRKAQPAKNEIDALTNGIEFADYSSALSAVYDIVS
jgi:hypothetical protein